MPWSAIIPLLVQYGLPTVQYIVGALTKGGNVTVEDINALIKLEQRSANDEMTEVLKAQGIDPLSVQGKAFLALTQ